MVISGLFVVEIAMTTIRLNTSGNVNNRDDNCNGTVTTLPSTNTVQMKMAMGSLMKISTAMILMQVFTPTQQNSPT